MNERMKYGRYPHPEDRRGKTVYYKQKQYLTWRLYIRIIQDGYSWFTPCNECQITITDLWLDDFYIIDLVDCNYKFISSVIRNLCRDCRTSISTRLKKSPIILGNQKYEPWVELNRAWVGDDKSIENVTEEEYKKHWRLK